MLPVAARLIWTGSMPVAAARSGVGVAGLGVEQVGVVVPAGRPLEHPGVERGPVGQPGQVGGQLGGVLAEQAGHSAGRTVRGERHATSPCLERRA